MPRSPRERFFVRLANGPILLDGGIGSLLLSRRQLTTGWFSPALVQLNLSDPDLVTSIHAEYLQAGAEVLLTNSFCASRPYLEPLGLADDMERINAASVGVAREAIRQAGKPEVFVAGSIAPLPKALDRSAEHGAFLEQARALLAAGADLLVCETFVESRQGSIAAKACRQACEQIGSDMPIVLCMVPPEQRASRLLQELANIRFVGAVDLVGLNCGTGVESLEEALEGLALHDAGPYWIKPSAGIPTTLAGEVRYPVDAARFAQSVADLTARFPIAAVGGCCGTTPEHIRSLKAMLARGAAHDKGE